MFYNLAVYFLTTFLLSFVGHLVGNFRLKRPDFIDDANLNFERVAIDKAYKGFNLKLGI